MGYRDGTEGLTNPLTSGEEKPGPCEHDTTIWNRDLPGGKQQRTCMDCGEKIVIDSRRHK